MLYIGIDIASRKHDCCILSEKGRILDQFTFANNQAGFQTVLDHICAIPSPGNIKIGLEATGIYGVNLTDFLRRNGFDVTTINPLIAKMQTNSTTLRKTKTDKADALALARMLLRKDFPSDPDISYHNSELKSLSRARNSMVKNRSALKNKAHAALMVVFPEYETMFSNVFGAAALAVLEKYPSAADIANARVSSLEKLLSKASRGRLGTDRAVALKELAKNSVAIVSPARAFELREILCLIRAYNESICRIEKEMAVILKESGTTITSVPGIGTVLGAMILGEIGDINRFDKPGQLLAFAGLEPSISDSGQKNGASGRMVKRGSPYLRFALIQAAKYAANANPVFRTYLDKKLAEGKHFNVAISHAAKKLSRIIFYILKNNSIYSIDYSLSAA